MPQSDWQESARDALVHLHAQEQRLNRARLALIPKLSPHRRAAVLSAGREGFDELASELGHLRSVLGFYHVDAGAELREVGQRLLDPFLILEITWILRRLAAVCIAAYYVRRRGGALLKRLGGFLLLRLRRSFLTRPVQ